MNSKIYMVALVMSTSTLLFGQTSINKSIPVKAGQKINLHFDYPELVRITTWEKNEISIQGSVSINGGENDDAFALTESLSGNSISVKNEIKNMKDLPHRITIYEGGEKIVFRNKEEFKKYQAENGASTYNRMSHGLDMEIILEIKVPRNVETMVTSIYGMVEVTAFNGPLTVDATYGGVDAALMERAVGKITAETNHGEIFSNLDVKFSSGESRHDDFHTYVSAKPGNGPDYNFDSKYGNVYLRKAN